jgi:hypothetical protein
VDALQIVRLRSLPACALHCFSFISKKRENSLHLVLQVRPFGYQASVGLTSKGICSAHVRQDAAALSRFVAVTFSHLLGHTRHRVGKTAERQRQRRPTVPFSARETPL